MPLQLIDSGASRNLTTAERLELSRAVGGLPLTVSHTTSVPLDASYVMSPHTVAGALTFAASSPTVGGRCVMRLTANGSNTPTFPGTKVGAGAWVNTAGIVNVVTVWSLDGAGSFHSIEQAGAAAATVPVAPTIGTATAGNGSASVTFTPGANGGSAILDYQITASTGQTATVSASPGSITMPNGTAATFTVRARNAIGYSPYSAASNSVTPSAGITVPGAPTSPVATAGDGTVSVAFTAPASNGGATITGYRVTLSTGQTATGSASPLSVAAPNGTAVTATVAATNSVGYGAESSASNSVTPTAAAVPAGTITRLSSLTNMVESGDGTAGWNYVGGGGATSSYSGYGISTVSLPADGAGYFEYRQPASGGLSTAFIGIKSGGAAALKTNFKHGTQPILGTRYAPQTDGASITGSGTVVIPANGDIIRIRRASISTGVAEVYLEVSQDNRASWILCHTWTGALAGQVYGGLVVTNDPNVALDLRSSGAA